MLSRLRALTVDLTPLRHRDFRLLWVGEIFSETGSSITLVAVYIQIYRLTGSAAAVGAIGLVQLVPLMLGSLFGGPLIDRHDRRRLLQIAQIAQAGGSILLLAGVADGSDTGRRRSTSGPRSSREWAGSRSPPAPR